MDFKRINIEKMDSTELIKDALDWADKRLCLLGEPITETQRQYIEFALRQNLVKNIAVTQCCTELPCNSCNGHGVTELDFDMCNDCDGTGIKQG